MASGAKPVSVLSNSAGPLLSHAGEEKANRNSPGLEISLTRSKQRTCQILIATKTLFHHESLCEVHGVRVAFLGPPARASVRESQFKNHDLRTCTRQFP